jgi:hypothetical protein
MVGRGSFRLQRHVGPVEYHLGVAPAQAQAG